MYACSFRVFNLEFELMFPTFHNPIRFILSSEVQFLRTFHEKKRNAFERRFFSLTPDEGKSFPPPTPKKKFAVK